MTDQHFIEDQNIVRQKLKELKKTAEQTEYLEELYIDLKTGQKWEKYDFEFEDQINYGIGLRKFPYPDTKQIIDIALTSRHPDEINGAAALLYEQERSEEKEFRQQLFDAIEKEINNITLDRFEIIYNRAELYDQVNHRAISGKRIEEIESDSKHFISMRIKADELMKRITTANITYYKCGASASCKCLSQRYKFFSKHLQESVVLLIYICSGGQ